MRIYDTERVTDADPDAVWRVWTAIDRWPEWDPHEEIVRMDAPFGVGATGYAKQVGAPGGAFTVLEVDPGRRFVTGDDAAIGRVRGSHEIDPLPDGRIRLRLTFDATGLLGLIIKVGWGRRLITDSRRTLDALVERAKASGGNGA